MTYTKNQTLLKIDHVSLRYGDRIILRDVNAEIQNIERSDCVQGQVICFLGPSGIGKTQLSRIIAGLQPPTSGKVLVASGAQFADSPILTVVEKGIVGMVPQTYPLFEFATVADNITIAGRQAGLTRDHIRDKGLELMNAFDLYEHRNDYPRALSGGTRQRVAIIRQLMCAGHYLVMDEPFSGLDPIMKQKACALITQVADRDTLNTMIIVTHDVTEGCSVADTVWLMGREKGQPGARVVKQYDLAAMDLCWHQDIQQDARFQSFIGEVKAEFRELV